MSTFLLAQDVKSEFEKIGAKYQLKDYSYNVSYSYYNDTSSSKPDEVLNGFVKVKGSMFHYAIGSNEVLRSSSHIVAVDKQNKVLMLDSTYGAEEPEAQPFTVDELLKVYEKVVRREDGGSIIYTLNNPMAGIKKIKLNVDKEQLFVKKIEMFFYENRPGKDANGVRNKLVMNFTNVNLKANQKESSFSISPYFSISNGVYTPNNRYKSFEIINHLSRL